MGEYRLRFGSSMMFLISTLLIVIVITCVLYVFYKKRNLVNSREIKISSARNDEINYGTTAVTKKLIISDREEPVEINYGLRCKEENFTKQQVSKGDVVDGLGRDIDFVEGPKSPEHKKLIGIKYKLQCKDYVFTSEELNILEKYGTWLSALASDKIKPETDMQEEFVKECKFFRVLSIQDMFSYHQNVNNSKLIQATWFKYLCRIKFERENPSITNERVKAEWGWQGAPANSGSGDHVFFSKK